MELRSRDLPRLHDLLRPHDLLRLRAPADARVPEPPDWVMPALEAAPWVVVRRAAPVAGRVPVGIRGPRRDQRCAAAVDPAAILACVTPEALARARAWETAARPGHPALRALAALAPRLDATGLVWGVAGGAGFELATGRPVLREASDLDIVLRASFPLPVDALRQAAVACEAALPPVPPAARVNARVDALVETPLGAFALAEFCGDGDTLLLRGAGGPRLVTRAELERPAERAEAS
ncbi:malonate decarboxylase holo-ACP synthase [Ancylobacter moscoviensis]